MESNHDDSYDVQFQRQSFEEKATRFDDMLEKLHAGDEFDEKFEELMRERQSIVAWLTKRKSGSLRLGEFKGIKSWRKEIKREGKELQTMLTSLLEYREMEQSRREFVSKLIF